MGLFGPSLPINRDEFEWLLACFAWLDQTLGERDRTDQFSPRLILPNDPALASATTASDLFEAVKLLAGLSEWECRLEKGEARREPIETGLLMEFSTESSALGTFSVEGDTPVVRYDPALLRDPDALVATFAHELAHLVIHSLGMPPGGETLEEHATDCAAVYLGFGVFLANSARNFGQFNDGAMAGWQSETSGYLSENALVTAVAIFERRFSAGEKSLGALKGYLRKPYRKAARYLEKRHPQLETDLRTIPLTDWA